MPDVGSPLSSQHAVAGGLGWLSRGFSTTSESTAPTKNMPQRKLLEARRLINASQIQRQGSNHGKKLRRSASIGRILHSNGK
mmetsp:Transcript_63292/g.181562  ORF Transcript_63292/g.181562 Transcript_63292/m.181562 type:complete len:82 (+) Transcript_63292:350-595(+)